ncbi:MAG: hypothetical protein KF845_08540 [Cyclobacteriaceae bacterium]|nr:hypothetical protein [Cyclobacteriaceae bacterium]
MNSKNALYFLFAICLVFGLNSCGSSGEKNANADEFKEAEESLRSTIEDVVYNIPSPTEIPYLIEQTGAEFNQGLVNPRSKADSYINRSDKAALNLGVYTADVGYLTSYEKTQEAIDYLGACKSLADHLGVIGAFDIDILKRFEAHISNRDSLANLLDESIRQAERFLKDDARNKQSALIVTGSFIEGLHISTGLVNTYPKDLLPTDARNVILTPVIQVILNQKKSVSELLKMLSAIEQTDPVSGIVSNLKELEAAYDSLNIEDQIKNNRADLVLSDKNLEKISEVVSRMRSSIVE